MTLKSILSKQIKSTSGLYVASFLSGTIGTGDIQAPHFSQAEQEAYAQAVMDCLTEVDQGELKYSDCTDGRFRQKLEDGGPVPVREKLVGADLVLFFSMAEALGDRFYAKPEAPFAERVDQVGAFLKAAGLAPSSHDPCGAAGGFVAVTENIIKFSRDQAYADRQAQLIGADIYNEDLFKREILIGTSHKLECGRYQDFDATVFKQVALKYGGPKAYCYVLDDGQGVHGHREASIGRLRTPGRAVDVNRLLNEHDLQIFSNNDSRMEQLANLIGRGHDSDYKIAYMAGEAFTSSGHATLGSNLLTLVIEAAV